MGGGGAIRTVAKAAGLGINSGMRSSATEIPARISAARSTFSTISLEHGDSSRLVVDKVESTSPRRVFSPPPTIEETKEATSELKDALEQVYISSSAGETDHAEATTCITSDALVVPSVSTDAMQAFKLLREHPVAQTVVASIACDPNVWNAVMQNEALMDYLKSGKRNADYDHSPHSSKSYEGEDNREGNYGFMRFLEAAKLTVSDWANNVVNLVKDLFESPTVNKTTGNHDTTSAVAIGGSLMALAVMVTLLVMFKRG